MPCILFIVDRSVLKRDSWCNQKQMSTIIDSWDISNLVFSDYWSADLLVDICCVAMSLALLERSSQGLSNATYIVEKDPVFVEIGPNEVCDSPLPWLSLGFPLPLNTYYTTLLWGLVDSWQGESQILYSILQITYNSWQVHAVILFSPILIDLFCFRVWHMVVHPAYLVLSHLQHYCNSVVWAPWCHNPRFHWRVRWWGKINWR